MSDTIEPAREPRPAIRIRHALAVAGVTAACALVPSVASASSYTVHSCRLPGGAPAPTTGWASGRDPAADFTSVEDTCAGGGALGAAVGSDRSGVLPDSAAWWSFRPPLGTELRSATLSRAARTSGNQKDGRGVYGVYAYDPAGAVTTIEGCNGAPCPHTGDTTLTFATPPAALRLQAWCYDNGDRVDACGGDDEGYVAAFVLRHAQLTLADVSPPTLTDTPTGSLLAPGAKSGPQQLEVSVADAGSGVGAIHVEADGVVIASRPATCAEPYTSPTPCPLARSETLTVDSSALAAGTHDIRVVVTDAAGNRTVSGPFSVATTGRVSRDGYKLYITSAGRGRNAGPPRTTLRVDYRRPPVMRGVLVDAADRAVTGALVGLYARRIDTNGPDTLLVRGRTNAEGEFTFKAPRGPSRVLTVAAFPDAGQAPAAGVDSASAAASFTLRVRGLVRWTHSSTRVTGGAAKFTGRLAGRAIPRRGKLVELQALDGRTWRTVETGRTSQTGKFRFRYRFRPVTHAVRYRFRIRVRYEASYPFEATTSAGRTVTVLPSR